jgi:hypothetical protein
VGAWFLATKPELPAPYQKPGGFLFNPKKPPPPAYHRPRRLPVPPGVMILRACVGVEGSAVDELEGFHVLVEVRTSSMRASPGVFEGRPG